MTQPENPVPARGARPQLFGTPASGQPRQPDFGPSILATIDGAPRRNVRPRAGVPLRQVLLMSGLALVVVAAYFGVKFSAGQGAAAANAMAVQPKAAAPAVLPKAAEHAGVVASQAASQSASVTGAASIENVAPPQAAASVTGPPANVAASLSNIQQVLAGAEPAGPRKPAGKQVPSKATESGRPAAPATARPGADSDAELLAAMLPHLKRRGPVPSSPAYEKRCGQLSGEAALDCRVNFCAGRERAADPACAAAAAR